LHLECPFLEECGGNFFWMHAQRVASAWGPSWCVACGVQGHFAILRVESRCPRALLQLVRAGARAHASAVFTTIRR